MFSRIALMIVLIASPISLGCKTIHRSLLQSALPPLSLNKITFDLSQISSEGLVGSGDGLRSLSYEFCIPANLQSLAEVKAIDSTFQHSRSPGRIRCTQEQYLVIGETHKSNWRTILTQLTQLNYIQRIDQFLGE
ncbi:MAG: hypothetical protein NW224_10065 [Leptolyngbyaceae cyanobacterium bins.302]|nr:hypothetical protein [Leptolyngbyaceae cyanobacterium bins.302]